MYRYKLTASDIEIEYFNHQLETLNKIAIHKNKEEVYENFFNDLWNDLIEDFEHESLNDFNAQNLTEVEFKDNRIRAYETLEELSTYTVFSLYTESHIESENELNTQLIAKYLEDFLKRQNNIENVRIIKIIEEN